MLILNRLSGFGVSSGSSEPPPAPLTTFSLADSSTSTSSSISVPAGVQAGDLILLADLCTGFGTPAEVVPGGFTKISSLSDSNFRFTASYKIAEGTETTLTGQTGSLVVKALALLRGDVPLASVTASTPQTRGPTPNDPSPITVTASSGTAPLVVVGFYGSSDQSVQPMTFTPANDGVVAGVSSGQNRVLVAWRFDLSAGQNTTIDMQDESEDNSLIGCYLELTV